MVNEVNEAVTSNAPMEPVILHQGRYRLYGKLDGGLHLVFQKDDEDTPNHMDLPAMAVRRAQACAEGNLSPMEMLKEMAKMRTNGGT